MNKKTLTIKQLAELVSGEVVGDSLAVIESVNAVKAAQANELTFLSDAKYLSDLKDSKAGAVLVSEKFDELQMAQVVVQNTDAALIEVLEFFASECTQEAGIHPAACVSESASIGENVSIGAFVVVEDGAEIGDNSIISSGCRIGKSKVGKNCRLDANVIIYDNCSVGNFCIIQAGSVIGSCGFGYRAVNNMPKLIPHLGGVVIEDFVEIGANCSIDRAKFGNTVIGLGTKLDNLVHIAHNVVLGKCCLITAQVGMAGSAVLGDGVIIGGQAGLQDHIKVGDGAMIGGQAGVMGDVAPGAKLFGTPADNLKDSLRQSACIRKLPELSKMIKELSKKVEKLESSKDNS